MSALPFQLLVFVGSFLLFQVELILARLLLPSFGSSASVWTTCLMFYQGVLFLGYLYAARATDWIARDRYRRAHLLFVAAPALAFPFRLRHFDLPPIPSILITLALSVGLPFLALSTTSIVVQAWFTRSPHPRRHDPYFLYGASNAGALLALLTYPFVIEPVLDVDQQLRLWYASYGAFVLLHLACLSAVRMESAGSRADMAGPVGGSRGGAAGQDGGSRGGAAGPDGGSRGGAAGPDGGSGAALPFLRQLYWLLLASGANALLLAVTNVVTMDAPVPLLWIVPLGVYLATLIVAFGRRIPDPETVARIGLLCLALIVVMLGLIITGTWLEAAFIAMHSLILLVGCLVCHTGLARARPSDTRLLGRYYLLMSLGGWLGSVLIAVVIPLAFYWLADHIVDYLAAAGLILAAFVVHDLEKWRGYFGRYPWRGAGVVAGVASVCLVLGGAIRMGVSSNVESARTFYGLYRVRDGDGVRRFQHGDTVHGVEDFAHPEEPLAYYHRGSPIGEVLEAGLELPRVGIVGLGIGILAAYQRPGETWDYYELDPEVERIARAHFSFLSHPKGPMTVIPGDARLSLERVPAHIYDLLVMDTFSSDFVPVHLITEQSMRLYLDKLKPDGLLFFHITNRIFDFRPVLTRIGMAVGIRGAWKEGTHGDWDHTHSEKFASRWFVFTRDAGRWTLLTRQLGWTEAAPTAALEARPVWTDRYVNLFHALR